MTYRAYGPCDALRPFVDSLWLQENPPAPGEPLPTRVVPTLGFELVVCYGDPFERVDDGAVGETMPSAAVHGQRTQGVSVRATGRTGMVIARCHPWAGRALAGSSAPADLANGYAQLTDVDRGEQARHLVDRVAAASSDGAKIDVVRGYVRRAFAGATPDPLVIAALRRLNDTWGRIEVASLARELSISRRHLSRRFVASTGHGVKRIARLVRFQKAIGSLRAGFSWADVVARCGYVDQAHLINESTAFVGRTPRAIGRGPTTPLMRWFNTRALDRLNTIVYL